MEDGNRILVTGGCGSVGSSVVRHLLAQEDDSGICVLDNDEHALFHMQREYEDESGRLDFVLADVRNQTKLERVLTDVDTVVHAAALKHVPMSEENPYESVKTNTIGTQHLIDAAEKTGVTKVLGVSTDKAAQPTSVMGATKMLSERLLTAADRQSTRTTYASVRLGNVIGTSGSVVRIFEQQIANGGPVTVTHPEMSRFMLPVSEAAEFIVTALDRMTSGEIFIPKMDAIRILDLADVMIELNTDGNVDPEDVDIDIVGIRPGERLYERLLTDTEARTAIELDESFVVTPRNDARNELVSDGGAGLSTPYHSGRAEHLSLEGIAELLEEV